jgi:3-methyladenine DNA glycosylase AlkD
LTLNTISIREIQTISILSNRPNSISIKANDQIFNSISKASSHFGVSLATIRARLNNPKYSNWSFINKERQVATNLARAVVVTDKYYLSVSLAGAAEGLSEKRIRKYIKTKLNWNHLDKLMDKQKKEIPNLDDIIRISKKGGYKLGRGSLGR